MRGGDPSEPLLIALGVLSIGGLAFDLLRMRIGWLNRFLVRRLSVLLKQEEAHRVTGATYLTIAAFIAFLLFDPRVAVSALLFLSLGDPAAALAGQRMPGPRVFGKSPVGTVAFIAVSLSVVAILTGARVVEYHWGLLVGAVVAGLVELVPVPSPFKWGGRSGALDDDLTIPLVSGAVMRLIGV